jgi:hypothetical protein
MTSDALISEQSLEQHYRWLINSPYLFQEGFLTDYDYQAFSQKLIPMELPFQSLAEELVTRKKENTKVNYHLPLGKYVEFLFEAHFKNEPHLNLLQHNTQVQEAKTTRGEIDYVLEIGQEIVHVELAIKFYLCYQNPQDATHWLGPNAKDSLANKLAKNLHAFKLTQDKNNDALWTKKPTQWQWLIKGCWFFHPNQQRAFYQNSNPESETGIWVKEHELALLNTESTYLLPNKITWIQPPINSNKTFTFKDLKCFCESHFSESNRALMVWDITSQTRVCVVHQSWPDLQTH